MANHILVQSRRQRISFHVRVETPLVFLLNELIDNLTLTTHRATSCSAQAGHTPRMFTSVCVTVNPLGTGTHSSAALLHLQNPKPLRTSRTRNGMLIHVRAIPRRRPFQMYLLHQMMLHQSIEAVIDRGHRDFWFLGLGLYENLIRRRMLLGMIQQHAIYHAPLRRRPQPGLSNTGIHHTALTVWRHKHRTCLHILHRAHNLVDSVVTVNLN